MYLINNVSYLVESIIRNGVLNYIEACVKVEVIKPRDSGVKMVNWTSDDKTERWDYSRYTSLLFTLADVTSFPYISIVSHYLL